MTGDGGTRIEPVPTGAATPPGGTVGSRALRRRWAEMIKRIYEVNPLICPSCGGEMRVVAFITEHEAVNKILRHREWREEGRGRGPPGSGRAQAAS